MVELVIKNIDFGTIAEDGSSVKLGVTEMAGGSVVVHIPFDTLGHLVEILHQLAANRLDIQQFAEYDSLSPKEAIETSGFGVGVTDDNSQVILSLQSRDGLIFNFALSLNEEKTDFSPKDVAGALADAVGLTSSKH